MEFAAAIPAVLTGMTKGGPRLRSLRIPPARLASSSSSHLAQPAAAYGFRVTLPVDSAWMSQTAGGVQFSKATFSTRLSGALPSM